MRIGVINWDCALPEDTYFGHYAIRSPSNPAYQDRIPYYADPGTGHGIAFRRKTQEEFEEGGYICPTRGPDGEVCTNHLDNFASAVRFWKANL